MAKVPDATMNDEPSSSSSPPVSETPAEPPGHRPEEPQSANLRTNGHGHSEGNGHARANGRRSIWRDVWRVLRRQRGQSEGSIRETLEELADQHHEDSGPIDPTERLLLENTLRLRGQTVEDVMVPRADIVDFLMSKLS